MKTKKKTLTQRSHIAADNFYPGRDQQGTLWIGFVHGWFAGYRAALRAAKKGKVKK